MYSPHWIELKDLADQLDEVRSSHLERVFIPGRPYERKGYAMGEVALKFNKGFLVLGLHDRETQKPYFSWVETLKKEQNGATKSALIQALIKYVEGSKCLEISALKEERILKLSFSDQIDLIFVMIPTKSEWILMQGETVLARTHKLLGNDKSASTWSLETRQAPKDLETRAELKDLKSYSRYVEATLERAAVQSRIGALKKEIQSRLKEVKRALSKTNEDPSKDKEAKLFKMAQALKACIYLNPKPERGHFFIEDPVSGESFKIPVDPKNPSPSGTAKSLFEKAQKASRSQKESSSRMESWSENIKALELALAKVEKLESLEPQSFDHLSPVLSELEIKYFPDFSLEAGSTGAKTKSAKLLRDFTGKRITTASGWEILAGRNKRENLDLTLKIARGNDVWLHVKGKPSAHVIVVSKPGKSVPLEVLLDAAQIVLHYSKGKDWGKTEVDYTFRKFVKRIPKTDEVSYTQNKTLTVEYDEEKVSGLLK